MEKKNCSIKRGHGKREYLLIKDKVEDYIRKGWNLSDIYNELLINKENRMSYRQFCRYANNQNQKKTTENTTKILNKNPICEQSSQNKQKPQQQHQQQNPAPAKRKIIGQEEKQEIKVVTLDDMVG